jgi:sulfonate transport system substrate-binding protein
MPKIFKHAFRLFAFAAVLASIPAFAAETPPKTIRLAGPGNAAGAPYGNSVLGVMRARGLLESQFKGEGVTVDWQFPRGTGPAINEAFANGQLDFSAYGGLPNIVGRGAGLRTKVLASNGNSPVYVIARKNAGIKSLADLKGHKISVSRGTIYEWSLNRVLAQAALSEKDLQIFDLQSADQISALSSGDIDAIIAGNNLLDLVDRGLADTIYTTKGRLGAGTNFGSFIVLDDFARKYPETTQRVVNTYVQAAYWASQEENRDADYDLWAKTAVPRAAFAKDYEGDRLADRLSPLLDGFYVSNVKSGIEFSLGSKLIRRSFDADSWIDRSYLDRAIQTFGYGDVWHAYDQDGKPKR